MSKFPGFPLLWFTAVGVGNPPDQKLLMYISVNCKKGINSYARSIKIFYPSPGTWKKIQFDQVWLCAFVYQLLKLCPLPFFLSFYSLVPKIAICRNTFWTKISKAVIVNHTQHFWHFFLVLRTVAFCCYNCLHLRREKFFPGVNSQHLVPTSFIIELIYCRSRRIIAP